MKPLIIIAGGFIALWLLAVAASNVAYSKQ